MTIACERPPIFVLQLDRSLMGSGMAIRNATRGDDFDKEWESPTNAKPSQAAVNRWLNEKLQLLYGPVLSEPIPEQLAQLIADHRNQKDC